MGMKVFLLVCLGLLVVVSSGLAEAEVDQSIENPSEFSLKELEEPSLKVAPHDEASVRETREAKNEKDKKKVKSGNKTKGRKSKKGLTKKNKNKDAKGRKKNRKVNKGNKKKKNK